MRRSVMVMLICLASACVERKAETSPDVSVDTPAAGATVVQAGAGGAALPPASPDSGAVALDAGASPPRRTPPASTADDAGDEISADASVQSPADASADAGREAELGEGDTLVPDPSWTCGMPDGIPAPIAGQLAFTIDFDVTQERDVGTTPFGRRRQLDVGGGKVEGARVAGRVLAGGLEYELTLDNGVVELEQIHVLSIGNELVFMRNCGVSPGAGVAARIVLDVEAAKSGAYAFLNEGRFVATRSYDPALKRVRMEVYEHTGNVITAKTVRLPKPATRPSQTWTCKQSAGAQGAEVYRATVEVATEWWNVGDSKYGVRNIIPILGGTLSGRLRGRVLPGGADYQIIVGNFSLDARYTLQTDDGELIIVRNCGVLGALIPTFETRIDGPYAWLNQGAFRSADPVPSLDLSEINLVIYEAAARP